MRRHLLQLLRHRLTATAVAAAAATPVQAAVSLDLFSNANDVVVVKDEKMRGLTRAEDEVAERLGKRGER